MTPGEMRGFATYLRSLREEWQTPPILAALAKLSELKYSTQDITEVCVAIALDHTNQLPVMLSMKGEELIRRKHQQGSKPRTGGGNKLPDQYKCDECGKVQSLCMSAARSADGAGHEFISAAQRNDDRDQMHADGRLDAAKAAARAKAISRAASGMFALPADVVEQAHPEPEQEAAS